MKLSLVISAVAVSSASAFMQPAMTRKSSSLNMSMDRRQALTQVGIAAAGLASIPSIASADGAVSGATKARARGIYGDRIAALASAVSSGDFTAVAEEKAAFVLFNSGAYPSAKDKSKKAAAIEGTNAIFRAIRAKDKAGLKSAYDSYVASNDISPLPEVSIDGSQPGQGYSSDFDYRVRSKAGAIYVR